MQMLANTNTLEDKRRSKEYINMFGSLNNPKDKIETRANNERSDKKRNILKNRLNRKTINKIKNEENKINETKDEVQKNNENIICCNICKTIINIEDYYRKVNPLRPVKSLADTINDHKSEIDKLLKKE